VRIPREQEQVRHELRHRREELTSVLAREPTVSELAVSLGVEEADIERALSAERARNMVPMSAADNAQAQPPDQVTAEDSDDRLVLASSLQSLDERERRIVFLRFHADMTERDIARELGISQAHVSRLLAAALARLRQELAGQGVEADTTADTTRSHADALGTRISSVGEPEDRGSLTGQVPAGSKAAHTYSGRFLVRMPASLHEQLAQAAEREQLSLNRLVTNLLSAAVSEGGAEPKSDSPAAGSTDTPRVSPRAVRLALATNLVVVVVAGIVAVVLLVLALERGI
jgi:RNA polymerase sigma factor (sigma-70 family)